MGTPRIARGRRVFSLIARLRLALQGYITYFVLFVLLTSVAILIGIYFNVTWELDAATRAEQAYFISQRGLYWYFFQGFGQGYYVWLPFWQLLLAGVFLLTGVSTALAGIAVSATSAGLTGLMVFSVLKWGGLERSRQFLGAILVLVSGYFVAYSSQGMTDVFSTMLLFGSTYCFFLYLESRANRYLMASSVLTLLNVMTRYESWLFLLATLGYATFLWVRKTLQWRELARVILYAFPSFLFIVVWLYYNFLVSGNYFGFAAWISGNVMAYPPATYHNVFLTAENFVSVLLLSNGLFWIALVDSRGTGKSASFAQFGLYLFVIYSAFFVYSVYSGFSDGWVRLFLYFVPFSAVSFSSKSYSGGVSYFILGVSIVLAMLGFAQNALMHLANSHP